MICFRLVLLFVATISAAPLSTQCGGTGEQANLQLAMGNILQSNLTFYCDECNEMMQSLASYCKQNGANSVQNTSAFFEYCYDTTVGLTTRFDLVTPKCEAFYAFVTTLYCPLDPCVQVTQTMVKAPSAVCDLMRCTTPPSSERYGAVPTQPLPCPTYVARIVALCQNKSSGQSLSVADCGMFSSSFQREGCALVVRDIIAANSPTDFCASSECSTLPTTQYGTYCEKVLQLPAVGPVPAPEYLAWLNSGKLKDCEVPPGFGINVTYATYGRNCSVALGLKNNILQSVRQRCNGKLNCTFGNMDMIGSSDWSPMGSNVSEYCYRDFEVHYSCQPKGRVHTIVAPEETKFQAYPFDCFGEFEKRLLHDENFAGMVLPSPRYDTAALLL